MEPPPDVVQAAARVAQERVRRGELCAALLERLEELEEHAPCKARAVLPLRGRAGRFAVGLFKEHDNVREPIYIKEGLEVRMVYDIAVELARAARAHLVEAARARVRVDVGGE